MLRTTLVALAAVVAVATTASAFQIKIPARSTLKATVVANEAGTVLFDAVPGKVEVTNLPIGMRGGAVFTAFGTTACPTDFAPLYSGNVYYLQGCSGTFQADGLCWQTPPAITPSCSGAAVDVGDCVVCRATD